MVIQLNYRKCTATNSLHRYILPAQQIAQYQQYARWLINRIYQCRNWDAAGADALATFHILSACSFEKQKIVKTRVGTNERSFMLLETYSNN